MDCQTIWLFDLDNTLHHADNGIFYLINRHMTDYLARKLDLSTEAASALRQDYWHRYGATLAGLQKHHPEICVEEFLRQSHPLPEILAVLVPMENTIETLGRLKGRKAIFSNGPSFYVQALADALNITPYFDALFGTDDFGLCYKPDERSYLSVCRRLDARPENCIMIDDSADNLHAAKALNMRTVWFGRQAHPLPFVDFAAPDMAALARWGKETDESDSYAINQ
ncbi:MULTISPECIES: pyrimidine 5'-nucleotidase [unclassified Neisseria]|uniref:pyrimidine 5'-nucleotidase n=1 Tax=unclassified Neisseria TaxID=2623750 RepID=UPI0026662E16|nr:MULTISPECIES: pyrimidine 5'-nucleotidase [unclassified Neisseria]MDO1510698.1 pyrimidine 5'-nucleotidase [Neisseria sp. MVDL19-042950]MDO1516988.1 pyrimidine 5'-nucleotidase [Neisseria sp. MVDL18-041461]MDO1564350.1 pyrimidine 5'-nucleotidase [Neisseria sp. MVDL20-010259]